VLSGWKGLVCRRRGSFDIIVGDTFVNESVGYCSPRIDSCRMNLPVACILCMAKVMIVTGPPKRTKEDTAGPRLMGKEVHQDPENSPKCMFLAPQ
jgi:hypothetical protein